MTHSLLLNYLLCLEKINEHEVDPLMMISENAK